MQHRVPYGLDVSVTIRREGDEAFVDVHAPLYLNKNWTMPHCYTSRFTDGEILRDHNFITTMINHYPSSNPENV